jgi:hypothetical protein
MRGRARIEDRLPEFDSLDDLARPRLVGDRERGRFLGRARQRALGLQGPPVLSTMNKEVIVRHLGQKRAEVFTVLELPAFGTIGDQEVGPDRLDDVHRVELGPERRRQSTTDHRPEERFIVAKDPLGGRVLAISQLHQESIERVGIHDQNSRSSTDP